MCTGCSGKLNARLAWTSPGQGLTPRAQSLACEMQAPQYTLSYRWDTIWKHATYNAICLVVVHILAPSHSNHSMRYLHPSLQNIFQIIASCLQNKATQKRQKNAKKIRFALRAFFFLNLLFQKHRTFSQILDCHILRVAHFSKIFAKTPFLKK